MAISFRASYLESSILYVKEPASYSLRDFLIIILVNKISLSSLGSKPSLIWGFTKQLRLGAIIIFSKI